jgi:hypothetical protein
MKKLLILSTVCVFLWKESRFILILATLFHSLSLLKVDSRSAILSLIKYILSSSCLDLEIKVIYFSLLLDLSDLEAAFDMLAINIKFLN